MPSSTLLLSSNAIPNVGIYKKSTAEEPGTKLETKAKQCPEISTQTGICQLRREGDSGGTALVKEGTLTRFTAGQSLNALTRDQKQGLSARKETPASQPNSLGLS